MTTVPPTDSTNRSFAATRFPPPFVAVAMDADHGQLEWCTPSRCDSRHRFVPLLLVLSLSSLWKDKSKNSMCTPSPLDALY